MSKQISSERKAAYYVGMILMVIGGLLFFSVFITGIMRFGDFSNFEGNAKSTMFRAVIGMAILFIGGLVKGIGARGLAGSGVVLDPKQAREELVSDDAAGVPAVTLPVFRVDRLNDRRKLVPGKRSFPDQQAHQRREVELQLGVFCHQPANRVILGHVPSKARANLLPEGCYVVLDIFDVHAVANVSE